MTSAQFRTALDRIGLSQVGAAKLLKVSDRTVRSWALSQHPIPYAIELIMLLLVAGTISIDDLNSLSHQSHDA